MSPAAMYSLARRTLSRNLGFAVRARTANQTEAAGGLTWLRADEIVPLPATRRELIPP